MQRLRVEEKKKKKKTTDERRSIKVRVTPKLKTESESFHIFGMEVFLNWQFKKE